MKRTNIDKNDVIDIVKSLKTIYLNRYFILKFSSIFIFIGIIISLLTPITYKSNLKFSLSSSQNQTSPQISSLASIAGINLNSSNNNVLQPSLYPMIFEDFDFKRKVLNIKLEEELLLKEYISNKKNIFNFFSSFKNLYKRISSFIFSKFNDDKSSISNILNIENKYLISDIENELFKDLNDIIQVNIDKKESTIEIVVFEKNPIYSSIICNNVFNILEKKIVDFNIKSSMDLLDFNKKNFLSKKKEFEEIQSKLANFKDNNQVISSSRFNIELFKLENEFNLVNSVYQELAKQVELSKIEITKDTPVFTILKSAEVPNDRFKPKRTLMVIIWFFIGLFLSIIYLFFIKKTKSLIFRIIN